MLKAIISKFIVSQAISCWEAMRARGSLIN